MQLLNLPLLIIKSSLRLFWNVTTTIFYERKKCDKEKSSNVFYTIEMSICCISCLFKNLKLLSKLFNDDRCGLHVGAHDYRDYCVGQLPQVGNIFLYIPTYLLDYVLLHT